MRTRLPHYSRRTGACQRFAKKAPTRRVIALATALVVGCSGTALVLAYWASAATPAAATAAHTQNPHIVPMAPPSAYAPVSGHAAAPVLAVPAAGPVPGAQLSATQLPAAAAQEWTSTGNPNTLNIAHHELRENECA